MMVVPTYPEGGNNALKVCQHFQHQVVRVGPHTVSGCQRLVRDSRNRVARDCTPADSAETFTVAKRTSHTLTPFRLRRSSRQPLAQPPRTAATTKVRC